jgi:hypothetical protein
MSPKTLPELGFSLVDDPFYGVQKVPLGQRSRVRAYCGETLARRARVVVGKSRRQRHELDQTAHCTAAFCEPNRATGRSFAQEIDFCFFKNGCAGAKLGEVAAIFCYFSDHAPDRPSIFFYFRHLLDIFDQRL